jgi:DNA-binding NtrC family response regulator
VGALEQSLGSALDVSTAAAGDVIDEVLNAELPLTRAREAVVSEFERRYVERVLARHGGNVARAAEASGIARRYFQILHARHKPR